MRLYSIKKIDAKKEFDELDYSSRKFIRNGGSVWAEMRFSGLTCYYFIFVEGEKMRKLAVKLVRQFVMDEERCLGIS